ncbi:MAG: aldehyde dehydrogenase family protein [Candidatus Brocadiales bacterium]
MARHKFLVAGEWRDTAEILEVRSPYDGQVVGTTYRPTEGDVEDAVSAATEAFRETSSLPTYRRSKILCNIRNGIAKYSEKFARTITLEAGKPIKDSRREVERAIHLMELATEEAKRMGGELLPLDLLESAKGRVAITRRFPVGPILGIAPFNFPLNLTCHKLAPAIAVGNTIIIKPASATPLTALLLAEVVKESGLPQGAFSVLPCTSIMAERMVADDRLKMLTFTGSSQVGWKLKALAGKKKVLLELGGNAGAIIDKDADIELAAQRSAYGAFVYSGQTCISLQRLYVHEEVYEPFLNRLTGHARGLKMGNPLEESTSIGPLITPDAGRRVEGWLKESVSQGAKVLVGGSLRGNNIVEPAIVVDTRPDMRINCEEVFGPLVTITRFSSFERAVDEINQSRFGLQAGIFTNDINKIFLAYRSLEVGGVIINDVPTFRADHMPYGGVKDSGMGREGIRYAIEEMTEPRVLVLNLR